MTRKITLLLAFVFIQVNLFSQNLPENIFTARNSNSYSYKWLDPSSNETLLGIKRLFPNSPEAANPDNSIVIKWTWNKSEPTWAGWGMQWRGWNNYIDFFSVVSQPTSLRDCNDYRAVEEFSGRTAQCKLQFKIKGRVTNNQLALVTVRFDGSDDSPSSRVPFLNYIYDRNVKSNLAQDSFRLVSIPFNEFKMMEEGVCPTAIKQIVFETPTVINTNGVLYIYDIKIIGRY